MRSWSFALAVIAGYALSAVSACTPKPAPQRTAPAGPTEPNKSPDCASLWANYHAENPEDPYVTRDEFITRCTLSEPSVFDCPARVRAELDVTLESIAKVTQPLIADAGVPDAFATNVTAEKNFWYKIATPSHMGICMTRERLRFALRTGRLDALAHDVAGGKLIPNQDGIVLLNGDDATLPWTGMVENELGSVQLGPAGEVRVSRRSDGRIWLYFLGSLLGRHQNQVGFLYSSGAFAKADFEPDGLEGQQVCIASERGELRPRRYLLPCFALIRRDGERLVEVGGAPD